LKREQEASDRSEHEDSADPVEGSESERNRVAGGEPLAQGPAAELGFSVDRDAGGNVRVSKVSRNRRKRRERRTLRSWEGQVEVRAGGVGRTMSRKRQDGRRGARGRRK
jgi:hypothetical protein